MDTRASRRPLEPLRVIGLTGGIAAGKSLVAAELAALGAFVLDADRAGHEVLDEPETRQAVYNHWGSGVISKSGAVDRRALAAIVFAPDEAGRRELAYLESLTHPQIRQKLIQQARDAAARGSRVAVLDAPVMGKAGWNEFCDILAFVDAPRASRLARALARGWSEADFNAREAAQDSVDAKRQQADVIIDNSNSVLSTHDQIVRLWPTLIGQAPPPAASRPGEPS